MTNEHAVTNTIEISTDKHALTLRIDGTKIELTATNKATGQTKRDWLDSADKNPCECAEPGCDERMARHIVGDVLFSAAMGIIGDELDISPIHVAVNNVTSVLAERGVEIVGISVDEVINALSDDSNAVPTPGHTGGNAA